MNNDTQIKQHIYNIVHAIGDTGTQQDFTKINLSSQVCAEIDALVQHIKQNY